MEYLTCNKIYLLIQTLLNYPEFTVLSQTEFIYMFSSVAPNQENIELSLDSLS